GQDGLLAGCARLDVPGQRRAALTYAAGPQQLPAAEAEHAAARAAGLPVEWRDTFSVPFPALAATWLPDQAQVDPVAVLAALTQEAERAGVDVRTQARVTDAHGPDGAVVTGRGSVRADWVVLATGTPFADRGGFFARLEPQRSYALAFAVPQPTGLQMSITAGTPTRSIRTAPGADGELLLVGGGLPRRGTRRVPPGAGGEPPELDPGLVPRRPARGALVRPGLPPGRRAALRRLAAAARRPGAGRHRLCQVGHGERGGRRAPDRRAHRRRPPGVGRGVPQLEPA